MSTLPDLDLDSVGFLAFYNVLEQTDIPASELDWADVTDHLLIDHYDIYDNGLVLTLDVPHFEAVRVRLKTDGWMVAYTDSEVGWDGVVAEESEYTGSGLPETNPYGAFNLTDWLQDLSGENDRHADVPDPLDENMLAKTIEAILSETEAWQYIDDFALGDVGFYEAYYNSSAVSLFSSYFDDDDEYTTRTVTATSPDKVNQVSVAGTIWADSSFSRNSEVLLEGSSMVEAGRPGYGTADGTNFLKDSGELNAGSGNIWGGGSEAAVTVVCLWSE